MRLLLGGAHLDSKLRAEISEIANTLHGNLDKVVQHGILLVPNLLDCRWSLNWFHVRGPFIVRGDVSRGYGDA